jgi:hypothetical protein
MKRQEKSSKAKPKRSTAKKSTTKPRSTSKKKDVKEKGLGDVVETITEKTGIKKAVQIFSEKTGIDCGCEERKEKWNKFKWPFGKKQPRCLTEQELEELDKTLGGAPHFVRQEKKLPKTFASDRKRRKKTAELYSKIFRVRYHYWCTCTPQIWAQALLELDAVRVSYKVKK